MLSLEALASMAILIALLLSMQTEHNSGSDILAGEQKIHDLLIVWARTGTGEEEMLSDAQLFFGKGNFVAERAPEFYRVKTKNGLAGEIKVYSK